MAEESKNRTIAKIVTFVVLTFLFSAPFYYWTATATRGSMGATGGIASMIGPLALFLQLMWMPALAGFATRLIFQRNLSGVGWKITPLWILLGYLLPILYCLPAFFVAWGGGAFAGMEQTFASWSGVVQRYTGAAPDSMIGAFFIIMTLVVATKFLSAAGEELGWRGFLAPELMKITSFRNTALISGVIWSIWHWPLMFFGRYNNGDNTPMLFQIVCFTVMVIGIAAIMTWLRMRSGSVWPAAMVHASHNTILGVYELTTNKEQAPWTYWITTEFGVGVALVTLIVGYFLWKKWPITDKAPGASAAAATA